ncbi:MAG: apolipoprotein N-acyltransferase [Alphaproteobacteria bacterium]|nr:apolipoprotein N-acyltransferase [Alphaproteobacteria bacterium]
MRVYVNVEEKRWKKYKIDFEKIANAAAGKKYDNAEVSITLVDDKYIKKINKKYRGINKPTNVLSFELNDDVLLGDIFISIDTVSREAKKENISVPEHVAHMVVHGILHLLGYDHIKDKDAEKMEKKETIILKKLGYKNPYAADSAVCTDASCCPGGKTIGWMQRFFVGAFGRTILYMLCGAVASLGFAPFYMWWATVAGIGGAYLLSVKTLPGHSWFGKFFRVLPFSAVYAMSMFWWVLHSIYVVPELANQFAIWTIPGLLGIGIVGGIIFSIPFFAISGTRINTACRPFLFAAVWTLVLWMREWLFTGFPWNPISNIAIENMYIANSMSLYGALGLTFVIIGIIASLCEIIRNCRNGLNWFALLIFIMFGVVGVIYGIKNIHIASDVNISRTPIIRIVQPAQSATQKASHSRSVAIQNAKYNLQVMASLAAQEGEHELVVFPETAYPFVVIPGDTMSLSGILSKPIIIGSNYFVDGNLYNSLLVAMPDGTIPNVYSKSHLVPFGEYRPFGNLIPTPGMLTPGNGPELIRLDVSGAHFVFAPAVCYEVIFSDSLIDGANTPDTIVNITNDNWFGKTPGTYQHLDMVRRYAIESGVPVVRSDYSGISAFVLSNGNVIADIPIGVPGVIDGSVWGAHMTMYRHLGRDMWMIILLVVSCMATIWMFDVAREKD